MQRRMLFQFASALLLVWMVAVAAVSAQSSAPSPLIVTEKDNGKSLELMVGHDLVIQLPSTPSTGYTWVWKRGDGPLEGGKQKYDADRGNMPGAGGTETFQFYAKETGIATITLDYQRSWENDPPAKTFTITVKVIPCAQKK